MFPHLPPRGVPPNARPEDHDRGLGPEPVNNRPPLQRVPNAARAQPVIDQNQQHNPRRLNRNDITDHIEQHEGRRHHAYRDQVNIPTVGVGFNLDRADARGRIEALGLNYNDVRAGRVRLNDQQINQLRDNDVDQAIQDARALFPTFDQLTSQRQRALADMAFNLGRDRLSRFQRLRAAVADGDWEAAANAMRNSQWARQVGGRADHDIDDIR